MSTNDDIYRAARSVLLDALQALDAHRESIVLVGAQAIYLRVGEADLAVAAFTSDGDLALDPRRLREIPPLEQALIAAGFTRREVGRWFTSREAADFPPLEIPIDLLVPDSSSSGHRSARLVGHAPKAARVASGLEGALVDLDVMTLASLDANDARRLDVRVAGTAALLVAKLHKIADRQGTGRQSDKDALDVLRILRGTETNELAQRYGTLLDNERASREATLALALLDKQFARRQGVGVAMAVQAAGPLASAAEIIASTELLAGDLLAAIRR